MVRGDRYTRQVKVAIVLPHQLFSPDTHPALGGVDEAWLVEHDHFFNRFGFHKQKLLLHRASMKAYREQLDKRGFNCRYLATGDYSSSQTLIQFLKEEGATSVTLADIHDHHLKSELDAEAEAHDLCLQYHEGPYFLTPRAWLEEWMSTKKRLHLQDFYIAQRKRLGILLGDDGEPLGGKWSLDKANRRSLPKNLEIPTAFAIEENLHVAVAKPEIATSFSGNPGELGSFNWPTTHEEASQLLDHFLARKFTYFGPYQDAISSTEPFLFHSLLSPALNTGLLTPSVVIQRALEYADDNEIPLESVEGFVRQIIGWREFLSVIYSREYVRETKTNFWEHRRSMPKAFYVGETGLEPVDKAVNRAREYGYAHHIERLMVLGNAMLLLELDPYAVYRWFMELFIDAYDWVMVPNVYGMSQYADGGLFATKPYISSSNYLRKMSNFPRGEWCSIWDSLYWRFIDVHREFFEETPRLAMMVAHLDRMDESTRRGHHKRAERYIRSLSED